MGGRARGVRGGALCSGISFTALFYSGLFALMTNLDIFSRSSFTSSLITARERINVSAEYELHVFIWTLARTVLILVNWAPGKRDT